MLNIRKDPLNGVSEIKVVNYTKKKKNTFSGFHQKFKVENFFLPFLNP
jgi:membrane-bound acyltransferase YfiQ involved in biofilm formation